MPVKTRTVHNNDAPWMSDKRFIKNDNGLYNLGIAVKYIKYYRDVVNVERKKYEAAYYDSTIKSVTHLKIRNW